MHLPRFMLEVYASCRRSPTGSKNTLWNHLGCMLANIRHGAFEHPVLFLSEGSFCCDLNQDFLPGKKPFFKLSSLCTLRWPSRIPEFVLRSARLLVGCLAFTLGLGGVTVGTRSCDPVPCHCPSLLTVISEDQMMVQLSANQHQQRHTSSSTLHCGNHTCRNHLLTFLGLTKTNQKPYIWGPSIIQKTNAFVLLIALGRCFCAALQA